VPAWASSSDSLAPSVADGSVLRARVGPFEPGGRAIPVRSVGDRGRFGGGRSQVAAYLLAMPRATRSPSEPRGLVVAALPMDVVRGDAERNAATAIAGIERAAQSGAQLIVLPEVWASSFPAEQDDLDARYEADASARSRVDAAARELGVVVAGSTLARAADGRPFNRFEALGQSDEAATARTRYDKTHLFTPTAEHLTFAPGESAPRVFDGPRASDGAPAKLAPAICYDLRFGALLTPLARAGVEVLVVPAQWPVTRAAHWRALVLGRAVELQCCVVACNRSGRETVGRRGLELEFAGNAIVASPDGEVLAEGDGSGALVAAELDLARVARLRREVPVQRDARELGPAS